MSKEKTLRTSEETEVMQATGVPAQETEEVSAALATEIIADLKKQLEEAKEAYQQALELTLYHYGKNHEYEILCRNIAAIEEAVRNA